MRKEIYILGVGNNTPVYIDLAENLGYSIRGLYHYCEGRTNEVFLGYRILGTTSELFERTDLDGSMFALSMGDNRIRLDTAIEIERRGGQMPTLIDPSAYVSKYAHLDEGVIVHSNATVQASVSIASQAVVSYNAGVSHDSSIGRGSYIACGAIVGAYVVVEEGVLVGVNSTIVPGKVQKIGRFATVGAGAVVTQDVLPFEVVAGNPARLVGMNCFKSS